MGSLSWSIIKNPYLCIIMKRSTAILDPCVENSYDPQCSTLLHGGNYIDAVQKYMCSFEVAAVILE